MRRYKGPRLNVKERAYLQSIGSSAQELKYDHERRLRNALLCLAQNDPRWMVWVQNNFKPRQVIGKKELLTIEARARFIVLKAYGYFGRQNIGELCLRHDWCFTDSGALSAG
jgi:hypothetical protein